MIYTQKKKDELDFVVNVHDATIYGDTPHSTFFRFSPSDYGFNVGDNVSEEWVLKNLTRIKEYIVPNCNTVIHFA